MQVLRPVALLGIRFVVLACTAVPVTQVAFADEWAKTFGITAGRPELRVETDDGSVTVRTWEETRISARVITSGWKIGPGEVEVREHQTGDHVELVVRRPSAMPKWLQLFGSRSIRVEVSAPRRIKSDIRTGDGSIRVEGLEGETRLRTGDGSIEAASLAGSLNAETGDGHMRIRGRLDMLALHTGDGSIEASVLPGSKMSAGWRVETGDGSVTIRLPRDFGTELDAHTGDGHIAMDLPAVTDVSRRQDKDLRARVHGGGEVFAIRTGDGSIRIGLL